MRLEDDDPIPVSVVDTPEILLWDNRVDRCLHTFDRYNRRCIGCGVPETTVRLWSGRRPKE